MGLFCQRLSFLTLFFCSLSSVSCLRCPIREGATSLPPVALSEQGAFKPRSEEPFDAYLARVKNTLVIQEYEKNNYEKAIKERKHSLNQLTGQRQELEKEQDDLRQFVSIKETSGTAKEEVDEGIALYIVKEKDTLQKIALDKYGTHTAWLALYRLNIDRLKLGPNVLEVGDVLMLPSFLEEAPAEKPSNAGFHPL
ncbi:MAG: hypothetical protein K0S07_775 [Chlamydiales bacterium]|jgi:nucleoid-associated protein YgaU|nr:hypothetical protein [Chlamydiales bacterium]